MNTNRSNTWGRITAITAATALLAIATAPLFAADAPTARGGAAKLQSLNSKAPASPESAAVRQAMACGTCRDASVTRVDWTMRGAVKPTLTSTQHQCGGCGTEWTVTGQGRERMQRAAHTCSAGGSMGTTCCNTAKAIH